MSTPPYTCTTISVRPGTIYNGTGASVIQPASKRGKHCIDHDVTKHRRRPINGFLSELLSMPLEVLLFEIFSKCHLADLISLTQTTKMIRAQLLSPSAKTVWMASRRTTNDPCVPDPPSDFISEFQWAILLFGGSYCTDCGLQGIRIVDFGILRRLCVSCRKANLIPGTTFMKILPDIHPAVMEGLPFSRRGWDRGHTSAKKRYYHREDVMKITRKFSFLLSNDSKNAGSDTGGEPVSQEWELRKTQIFNYMNQRVEVYEQWQTNVIEINSSKAQRLRDARFTSIKTRLTELGYHERDIEHPRVRRHKMVNTRTRLTEQAWVKMLPTLQPILVDLERTRRTQTRYMRIYTFDCYYRSLLRDLIPMQSLYTVPPRP